MKKQTRKLNLSKRTISNLDPSHMDSKVGGKKTNGHTCDTLCGWTQGNFTCGRNCGSF